MRVSRAGALAALRAPENYHWVALALATLGQTSSAMINNSIGPLGPFIQRDLGISRGEFGWCSSATRAGSLFSIMVSGWATDRFGVRVMLSLSLAAGSILLLVATGMPTFLAILVFMLLSGMARGPLNPATTTIVAHWFPTRLRGLGMGIKQTGVPLGGAIAGLVVSRLAEAYGWRVALSITSVVVLLISGVCFALYRNCPLPASPHHAIAKVRSTLHGIVTDRDLLLMSIFAALLVGVQNGVLAYWALYLHEVRGLSEVTAAGYYSVVMVGGFVARIALGHASDRIFAARRKGILVALTTICVVESVFLAFYGPSLPGWGVLLTSALWGVSAVGWNGLYFAMVVGTCPRETVATVTGYSMTIQELGNFILPPVFGYIADATGSYQWSWVFLFALSVLALASLAATRERVRAE